MDAGHVCQNLYLACEGIDCGTCAIAAYDQLYCDTVLSLSFQLGNKMPADFIPGNIIFGAEV
ncbi:MAG: hypothetical protein ACLFUN_06845 [Desulfobacterales bacterium]